MVFRSILGVLVFSMAAAAMAQPREGRIAPVEVRSCDFVDGHGESALIDLAAELNGWMAMTAAPERQVYALLPLAHSDEIAFDVLWVDAWSDGATMGESMAHRREHGAALVPFFERALNCNSIRNFSVVTVREPLEAGRLGPLEATTCTLRLGASLEAALQAVGEWVDYTETFGSTAAHWLLFPAYGERSDADYTFKWAVGYASFDAFGRDYEQLTNGNGLDRFSELLDPLVRCDSPRLYDVRPIRAPRE
jgi:hypothetical protein